MRVEKNYILQKRGSEEYVCLNHGKYGITHNINGAVMFKTKTEAIDTIINDKLEFHLMCRLAAIEL